MTMIKNSYMITHMVYVRIFVYMYLYMCLMCVCVVINIHICVFVINICTHTCTYTHTHTSLVHKIYVYIYIFMYLFINLFIYSFPLYIYASITHKSHNGILKIGVQPGLPGSGAATPKAKAKAKTKAKAKAKAASVTSSGVSEVAPKTMDEMKAEISHGLSYSQLQHLISLIHILYIYIYIHPSHSRHYSMQTFFCIFLRWCSEKGAFECHVGFPGTAAEQPVAFHTVPTKPDSRNIWMSTLAEFSHEPCLENLQNPIE